MRLLGVKAYRFSLSWARLMPEGTGAVNEKAVALYRDYPYTDKPEDVESSARVDCRNESAPEMPLPPAEMP